MTLTLMREMSVICVSILSNLTCSLTRPLLLPTEMNLDNATTHHLLRFNKSNQANQSNQSNQNQRTRPAEPSKPSQWMTVTKFGKYGLYNGLVLQPCFCIKQKKGQLWMQIRAK